MSSNVALMDDIVEEARFDWIDLGHAVGIVDAVEGGKDDLALLRRAGPLVVRLVRDGRLSPGEIGNAPGAFVPWASSPEESARHLEHYLEEVLSGAEPFEPWKPCMFAATDRLPVH